MPFRNVAKEIAEFVDKYIDCFVSWDILVYFHENPEVEIKLSELALEIGRRESTLETSLSYFLEQNIIVGFNESGNEQSYRYTAPLEFRNKMDGFLAATRDRTNRLAIVSMVLQKESRRL